MFTVIAAWFSMQLGFLHAIKHPAVKQGIIRHVEAAKCSAMEMVNIQQWKQLNIQQALEAVTTLKNGSGEHPVMEAVKCPAMKTVLVRQFSTDQFCPLLQTWCKVLFDSMLHPQ